jgi:membrane protease YdiL (CAAX protease family)
MMNMRFLVSVVVLFIVSMVLGFVVHGLLLGGDYQKLTPNLFRTEPDSQAHFAWMLIAHVLMAVGFTWVYRAGRNNRPWLGQGVRFGIAIALLAPIPGYLIYYAVQPMPFDLVVKQVVFDTIAMVVMGISAAAINRDPLVAAISEADEDMTPMPR